MPFHVGVDVGGTFTDTIAIDADAGAVKLSKVPSTPSNQAVGFLSGLRAVGIPLDAISWLVHGTTVGTNATLERTGAVCGMITTRGFRDVIELARRDRPQLYGLFGRFEPLIRRDHRLEVTERMGPGGEVLEPLDENELRAAVEALKARGVESLLIGFLHSYANPAHEERARDIARELWPNPYITTSVDVLREFREVERFGTAALNAYIQPVIHRYVKRLKDDLKSGGVRRSLAIMQANGGIMSADMACERAVNTVLSGPAAGVIAASYISRSAGFKDVITGDLGGTSFDVGMIVNGQPIVSSDRDLAFNLPMRIPVVDIHTIGAGGGSIAHVNEAGILQVGPRSAGAVPGPVAFGRGGDRPTVTDANVVLGRLSSDRLLGVEGAVDMPRVRGAFEREVGGKLGLGAVDAAAATLRVVNDAMAGAIRLVSLQRGFDPREFALFVFGGAGPLHGVALARELGIPRVVVPFVPGITCALGAIVADARHDFVQTVSRRVDDVSEDELRAMLRAHRSMGEDRLREDGVPVERVEVIHQADMQYEGQTYTLRVSIDADRPDVAALKQALQQAYIDQFGIDLSNFRAKLINVRTAVVGVRSALDLRRIFESSPKRAVEEARIGERDVWFAGEWIRTPIYDRGALPFGAEIVGPAILNQMDTTTVVEPGNRVSVDRVGNLIITVN